MGDDRPGADDAAWRTTASAGSLPAALGAPATRALLGAGFGTLDDLRGASERELLALHGVGPRAIRILREHGVALAP